MGSSVEFVTVSDPFTLRKENSIASSDSRPGQEGAVFGRTGSRSQDGGLLGSYTFCVVCENKEKQTSSVLIRGGATLAGPLAVGDWGG